MVSFAWLNTFLSQNTQTCVIFEVLRVVGVKTVVIWDVTRCSWYPSTTPDGIMSPEECHFESFGNYAMQYKLGQFVQ